MTTTSASRSAVPPRSSSSPSRAWLHRLPDELSWTMGALVEPFSVAYYALMRVGGVDASDTARGARRRPDRARRRRRVRPRWARTTIVVEPVAHRREEALALGRAPRRRARRSWTSCSTSLTGGRGADVVIEASGRPEVMARALEIAALPGAGRLHRHRRGPGGAREARADPVQGAHDHRLDRLARGVARDAALPGEDRDRPHLARDAALRDRRRDGGARRAAQRPAETIKAHIELTATL